MGFLSILLLYRNVQQMIFFNLEIITSCHYIQYITLHKCLVYLTTTNLKYKDHNNFCQFNLGPVQISPAVNTNVWEPLNKKGLYSLHINISSLPPKFNELKWLVKRTKVAIIQEVIQAFFEIGSRFWGHKNLRPNFDELAKKIKPKSDITESTH